MRSNQSRLALSIVLAAMLAGCAAPPPRSSTYYDNGGGGYYDRGNSGYYDRDRSSCSQCGRVTDVERVYAHDRRTSGGGAVIGAIVGGLLGSTVGHGDGRTAATVAGAVAGGFAGNAVERNENARTYNAYRFYVALDDGRSAVVTQYDNPGFRPGDRVMIRNSHLVMLR
ncbi:MAG TPA: glycine zipper 2TM domain-containing protein [Rhodanobacteraceae bacterium]|jgi:outer membrane lipoprotein SlyB|nr:glycine zipper 2TM domain-containing protein [Rhodanobacteraceae bacterium]